MADPGLLWFGVRGSAGLACLTGPYPPGASPASADGITCVHEVVVGGEDSGSLVLRLGVDDLSMLASEGLLVALLGLDVRGDALTRCRASPAPSVSVKLGSSGIDGILGASGAAEGIGGTAWS